MKKIGILGLGVVGKSVLDFFKNKNYLISVWDEKNNLSKVSILDFLQSNDFNFITPGISYKKYESFYKKHTKRCFCELDILNDNFYKDSIAVTGSLGKTTIAKLITVLLEKNKLNIGLAGNIGRPMLDLIQEQNKLDMAVLELSSFQLYLNKTFAPNIAIWSNFYPNHLNWHETEKHYFDSKFKIFEFQKEGQFSLLPIDLVNKDNIERFKFLNSILCFVMDSNLEPDKYLLNIKRYLIFYVSGSYFKVAQVVNCKIVEDKTIFDLRQLPGFSFLQNWLFVLATLFLSGVDLKKLNLSNINLQDKIFEHRLELFTTINGVDFYNDSKSTVIQATRAAINNLNKKNRPIILILGGFGKGVDRSSLIKILPEKYENLKEILFFGNESNLYKNLKTYSTIDSVLEEVHKIAKSGDQVLFSPSGSSFDLFDNYMHRGKVFKELVLKMYNQI